MVLVLAAVWACHRCSRLPLAALLRDAAVLAAVLAVWCWLWGLSSYTSWRSGYSTGSADTEARMRAERLPAIEQARRDAVAELTAPVGQGTCSVVSRDRVIAKAVCVKSAMGYWLIDEGGK